MKICNGTTRLVILIGKYAGKIPQIKYGWELFLRGLLANMQEIEFAALKDCRMCPIKYYISGGWLIIMPRCLPITEEEFLILSYDKFWPNSNEDYHPNNVCEKVSFNVPVENKQDSFGYYNGEIVAVDYGS